MARYDSILDTIGNTPLVRLARLAPPHVEVWAKVESMNPMGSVKDRMARAVVERARARGHLAPGQTVIEATSGNTGIGLAMVCARLGHPLVVTMAENFSIERRRLLRFLGAQVVLTPASEKGTGMLNKAVELADAHGWYLCRQFENEANADIHTETTAREILDDFDGDGPDFFVSGFGTGGTLKGVARGLKACRPSIRVVAAEPDNAPLLGSRVPQPRDEAGRPSGSHPSFRPHLMQGWSPDFVSKLTEEAQDLGLVDRVVGVSGEDAMERARALAREEGIFAGTSSGATLAATLLVASEAPEGSRIVCMLPDTGERYLSTPLFEGVAEEMDADERAISRSTPSQRFDVTAPAPTPGPRPERPAVREREPVDEEAERFVDEEAERFVDEVVAENHVVMFALAWCEFCWSARKLFAHLAVDFRSVDLDSVPFQRDDLGGRIRAVLSKRTGASTIPQIYVGGKWIGGCTDLFDAYAGGALDHSLCAAGNAPKIDPNDLLPAWIHPRGDA